MRLHFGFGVGFIKGFRNLALSGGRPAGSYKHLDLSVSRMAAKLSGSKFPIHHRVVGNPRSRFGDGVQERTSILA